MGGVRALGRNSSISSASPSSKSKTAVSPSFSRIHRLPVHLTEISFGTTRTTIALTNGITLSPRGSAGIRLQPVVSSVGYGSGTPVALQTHDGGDSAAVGDASGPMWQEDTDYQGRVFVGVGTLQPSATAVLLGATGGVDQVKLTSAQSGLPAHTHSINSNGSDSGVAGDVFTKANGSNANAGNTQSNIAADAAEFHTNMPPYRAGYIIKRTARVFYKA
jgi:hypothetical protein